MRIQLLPPLITWGKTFSATQKVPRYWGHSHAQSCCVSLTEKTRYLAFEVKKPLPSSFWNSGFCFFCVLHWQHAILELPDKVVQTLPRTLEDGLEAPAFAQVQSYLTPTSRASSSVRKLGLGGIWATVKMESFQSRTEHVRPGNGGKLALN